ncbi:hypothetical protein J2T14_005637 [Paenibacillus harenae]|nr:hypothetical protein [Paenibacillus harenae]
MTFGLNMYQMNQQVNNKQTNATFYPDSPFS